MELFIQFGPVEAYSKNCRVQHQSCIWIQLYLWIKENILALRLSVLGAEYPIFWQKKTLKGVGGTRTRERDEALTKMHGSNPRRRLAGANRVAPTCGGRSWNDAIFCIWWGADTTRFISCMKNQFLLLFGE